MSETQKVPVADFNPYAADQMPEGGGLTREIIVTSARYVFYPMTYKDGSPVKDAKTGEPSFFSGLRIEALSEKNEGKIDKYEWSAGKKARPSADGEMLVDETGKPAKVYKTSNLGKAIEGLRAGGFDPQVLYPRVSALVGAKLTLEGVNKLGADGKPKTHTYEGKTYNDLEWFPVAYKGGAGQRVATGGAGAAPAEGLIAKAEAAVVAALKEAGGSLERKDLIRALGTALKGDADAVRITTMVAQSEFHTGKPWELDATTSKLTLKASA